MPVSLVSVVAGDVCSLEEIRQYLQVPGETSDNSLIQDLGRAAVETTQNETRRKLLTHTLCLWLSAFPVNEIPLPFPPLQEVSEITFVDPDGEVQTVDAANFIADKVGEPGCVKLADGVKWPITRAIGTAEHPWPVKIKFKCGYGANSLLIPATFRTIVKSYIKLWFDVPNPVEMSGSQPAVIPMHAQSLISLVRDDTQYPAGTW